MKEKENKTKKKKKKRRRQVSKVCVLSVSYFFFPFFLITRCFIYLFIYSFFFNTIEILFCSSFFKRYAYHVRNFLYFFLLISIWMQCAFALLVDRTCAKYAKNCILPFFLFLFLFEKLPTFSVVRTMPPARPKIVSAK